MRKVEPGLTFDELVDVSVDHLRLPLVGGVPRHVDDLHREPNAKKRILNYFTFTDNKQDH